MCCRTCGSATVGARDDLGYRTCVRCGRDWLDGTTSVVGIEQSRVTGRWYVTEDGRRVPAVGHRTEQLRADRCLVPAR